MNMTDDQIKVAATEALAQSRENSRQIDKLAGNIDKFVTAVESKLDKLDAKLDGKTQTNWSVIWAALGVVAMIVIPASGLLYFVNKIEVNYLRENQLQFQNSMNTRVEFVESTVKDELKHRAYLWDNYVYQSVTEPK